MEITRLEQSDSPGWNPPLSLVFNQIRENHDFSSKLAARHLPEFVD
jgi:hypothetical protein